MLPTARQQEELLSIARAYGTPTYVYDGRIVQRQVQALRTALKEIRSFLLYALKANSSPALVRLLRDLSLGADVVSPGELVLARRLDFPPDRVLFSANNMTDEEMLLAVREGVLLNIGELTRLEKFGRQCPGAAVSVRINPEFGAGHHEYVVTAGQRSKFGIPVTDLERARAVAAAHSLRVVGLHQHIGSGNLQVQPYEDAIRVLFEKAADFPEATVLNIGGGIGVAYRPEEPSFDLDHLARVLAANLNDFAERYPERELEIWLEPGRFLTADCGVLLVEVNTLKKSFGQTFVGTNSGMSQLIRPAIYGAYHGVVNVSNPNGAADRYNIVGNICESSDFFAHDREVSDIREGDILAICDAGAYGMAMASEYNLRPLPSEVFIDLDGRPHLERIREAPHELVDRMLAGRRNYDSM